MQYEYVTREENMSTEQQATPPTAAANPRKTLAEKMEALEKQKNRLAARAAALSKEARKARNGQLIAWGLWVEHYCITAPAEQRAMVRKLVLEYLKDRNLARAREGFARLDAEMHAKSQEGKGES